MLLAEALALRGGKKQELTMLQSRIQTMARVQEGEPAEEEAADLIAQAADLIQQIAGLTVSINTTNMRTTVHGTDISLTEANAERDRLLSLEKLYTMAADAGTGGGTSRRLFRGRNEIPEVCKVDVPALREQAKAVMTQFGTLNSAVQRTNWSTELVTE